MGVFSKNLVEIKNKPRVYFTCHPDDFVDKFSGICDDVFDALDCLIFFSDNPEQVIPQEDKAVTLQNQNLFIVAVTRKFLTEPNYARDFDIKFAVKEHIPILPIIMEEGIEELYSKSEELVGMQYLNYCSCDYTEVPYKEKLKKYLESFKSWEDIYSKIHSAFDGYAFLSYRKKDRNEANKLIKLIHKSPDFRGLAIWYDEFLTLGEIFDENIMNKLTNCNLFLLLVTPNTVEKIIDENGVEQENYVVSIELPTINQINEERVKNKEEAIGFLPVKMGCVEATVESELKKYGVPDVLFVREQESFFERLGEVTQGLKINIKDMNPERLFFIGLAYLYGVDVEVDRAYALENIESSAKQGNSNAIKKLIEMYSKGEAVEVDKEKEEFWLLKLIELYEKKYEDDPQIDNLFRLQEVLFDKCEMLFDSGEINQAIDELKYLVDFFETNARKLLQNDTASSDLVKLSNKQLVCINLAEKETILGTFYLNQKDYAQAELLFNKSCEDLLGFVEHIDDFAGDSCEDLINDIKSSYGIYMQVADNYGFLASIKSRCKEYEKAVFYEKKRLEILEKSKQKCSDGQFMVYQESAARLELKWNEYKLGADPREILDAIEEIKSQTKDLVSYSNQSIIYWLQLAQIYQYMALLNIDLKKPIEAFECIYNSIKTNLHLIIDRGLLVYRHNLENDYIVLKVAVTMLEKVELYTECLLDNCIELYSVIEQTELKSLLEKQIDNHYLWCMEGAVRYFQIDDSHPKILPLLMDSLKVREFFYEQKKTKEMKKLLIEEYINLGDYMYFISKSKEAQPYYLKALNLYEDMQGATSLRSKIRKTKKRVFWDCIKYKNLKMADIFRLH